MLARKTHIASPRTLCASMERKHSVLTACFSSLCPWATQQATLAILTRRKRYADPDQECSPSVTLAGRQDCLGEL